MAWTPPKTESEWQEKLSALLDEELEAAEAQALTQHLKQDSAHAEMVRALEGARQAIKSWIVDPIAPPASLLAAARRADAANQGTRRTTRRRKASLWFSHAAILAVGCFIGIAGMGMYEGTRANRRIEMRNEQGNPNSVRSSNGSAEMIVNNTGSIASHRAVATGTPTPASALSQRQIETLLRETQAAATASRIRALIARGQTADARAAWEAMGRDFGDTQQYQTLEREYAQRPSHLEWALAGGF